METEYLILVLGMGGVTYLPRWVPLYFLSRHNLPRWLIEWLGLIPAAILSALLFPALVVGGPEENLDPLTPELIAALPTLLFALKTKSLGGTVVFGMIVFWLTEKIV